MSVDVGTPITQLQATQAVLRMVDSAVMPTGSPGVIFTKIYDEGGYDRLSSGEQRLVDIAFALWRGGDQEGARIGVLGGLDRTLRRKVLLVLVYYYLGRDLPIGLSKSEFFDLFAKDEL